MVVKIRAKVIKKQGSIEKNGKKTLILFIIISIGFPGSLGHQGAAHLASHYTYI